MNIWQSRGRVCKGRLTHVPYAPGAHDHVHMTRACGCMCAMLEKQNVGVDPSCSIAHVVPSVPTVPPVQTWNVRLSAAKRMPRANGEHRIHTHSRACIKWDLLRNILYNTNYTISNSGVGLVFLILSKLLGLLTLNAGGISQFGILNSYVLQYQTICKDTPKITYNTHSTRERYNV